MKKYIKSSLDYSERGLLYNKVDSKFCVNGPAYRGARMPAPNPSCINEASFDDELRMKSVDFDVKFSDSVSLGEIATIVVDWTTQEPFTTADSLCDEIERWARYNFSDFPIPLFIKLYVTCRDGEDYGSDIRERRVK